MMKDMSKLNMDMSKMTMNMDKMNMMNLSYIMMDMSSRQILLQRLAPELGVAVAETLMAGLPQATGKPDAEARVLTLLDELQELSEKAAGSAVAALPK